MSSIANALDDPVRYNYSYSSAPSPVAHDHSVDMETTQVKEEPNPIPAQAVLHRDVGEEPMDDLFGQDADADEPRQVKSETSLAATPAESGYDSEDLSQSEKERRRALEYPENDEPTSVVEDIQEANVSIPNIPIPRTSDGDHWVIRVPSFVKVDSKPFHPDTYMGPEQDEEDSHPSESIREKSMSIKLKVENTVRWRWVKDEFGQDRRQSNSRIIRWSDGSLSLRLGKELFDINQTIDTSGGVVRQSIVGSQPASQGPSALQSSTLKSQGLTYLVAQHKRSEVLQAEALITGYMTLRPTGMQSETHRMLVRAVGQKHSKIARLRMAPEPTMDPEREKQELLRLSAKKSKKRADEAGFGTRRKRSSGSRKRSGHDVWTDDEEQEYDGTEDEDDPRAAKRKAEARKGGEYQEDDFVVADESDEDGADGGGSGKKRRRREEEAEDPLDRLDAKIDQQQEEERKRKNHDPMSDDHRDMDVESEEEEEDEEEDEHRVRKARSGTRKTKRTLTFGEEEEE